MDNPESVVEFYEAAKNLWEKADSIKVCDENNVEELLKALVVLHLKALYLPNFELRNSDDLPDSEVARINSVLKMKILYRRRIGCVPKIEFKSKEHYHEFFDSYDAGSTVTASLSDDMDGILMDVGTGICLYEHGYQAEAVFEWKHSFMIHWGEHITGAIRALDSMYRPFGERSMYGEI